MPCFGKSGTPRMCFLRSMAPHAPVIQSRQFSRDSASGDKSRESLVGFQRRRAVRGRQAVVAHAGASEILAPGVAFGRVVGEFLERGARAYIGHVPFLLAFLLLRAAGARRRWRQGPQRGAKRENDGTRKILAPPRSRAGDALRQTGQEI